MYSCPASSRRSYQLILGWLALAAVLIGLFAARPPAARAGTALIVTKAADTNDGTCDADCSLREAIVVASAGDTINFNGSYSIVLNNSLGPLFITKNLTIDGSGYTVTISGGNQIQIFFVASGKIFDLKNLTVMNGSIGAFGGGLDNDGGVVTVTNVTFKNNTAVFGGGVYNNGGTLNLINVTMTGNTANQEGGGIYNNDGAVNLTNVTMKGNTADDVGYDVLNVSTMNVKNSILASNPTLGCINTGTITDGGNNIDSGISCGFETASGSLNGTNPQLGTLTGSPDYYPLASNSPAIDGVTYNAPNGCPSTDERGQARNDLACDIGAFEYKLTDGHSISKSIGATVPYTYTFGPTLVKVVVTLKGTLSNLTVQQTDSNHSGNTCGGVAGATGVGCGHYWTLTAVGSVGNYNLTLPALDFTPDGDTHLCKYVSGSIWNCGEDSENSYTSGTVTRSGLSGFSDWAVGNQVSPTALGLRSFSARNRFIAGWPLAVLVLLGLAALGWPGLLRRKATR